MIENINQLVIINPGTLNIENLESFLQITNFDPGVSKFFPAGFLLAEPIRTRTGGVLYPKDVELNAEFVKRLDSLGGAKSGHEYQITIKKSAMVADFFRQRIKSDFTRLLEAKKEKQEFRSSIDRLEKTLSLYLDDILGDDELIYILIRGRFVDEFCSSSGIPRYFYHSINVAILALELLHNARYTADYHFEKQDLLDVAVLSLLHDIGSIENLWKYAGLPKEQRKKQYLIDTKYSFMSAKMINLEDKLVDALKIFAAFHHGRSELLYRGSGDAVNYANILVTADLIDLKISGLFDYPATIKAAMDHLYILVNNKILRKSFVDALAKGLRLDDLFNFYFELDRLNKMCILKKYAQPYPMLGFKSPVLYICAGNRTDCPEYSKSSTTVNLLRPAAGMKAGVYGRCKLLSEKLVKFYESHYDDIKENINLKRKKSRRRRE